MGAQMIYITTDAQPYTPPWYRKGSGPLFLIRAGDVGERELFEAELAGEYDAGRVLDMDLEAAFEEGIETLLADAPQQLEGLRALLAAERDIRDHNQQVLTEALGKPVADQAAFIKEQCRQLPPGERQGLEEARRLMHQHWPDYRALVARQARRQSLLPLVAFRRFCAGWERLKQPFEAGPDGMPTLAAIRGIPQNDMKAAGLEAYRRLYAASAPETRKNLSAPAKSANARRTSRSGAGSKKGGRSRGSAG